MKSIAKHGAELAQAVVESGGAAGLVSKVAPFSELPWGSSLSLHLNFYSLSPEYAVSTDLE